MDDEEDENFLTKWVLSCVENNPNVSNETQLNSPQLNYEDPWLGCSSQDEGIANYGTNHNRQDRLVNDEDIGTEGSNQNNIIDPAQTQVELLERTNNYMSDEQHSNRLIERSVHTELNSSHNRVILTSNYDVASIKVSSLATVSFFIKLIMFIFKLFTNTTNTRFKKGQESSIGRRSASSKS